MFHKQSPAFTRFDHPVLGLAVFLRVFVGARKFSGSIVAATVTFCKRYHEIHAKRQLDAPLVVSSPFQEPCWQRRPGVGSLRTALGPSEAWGWPGLCFSMCMLFFS